MIFFLTIPAFAGQTFTDQDLQKYKKSPLKKQAIPLDDICDKVKKTEILTDYEISTMLRESEYSIKYLDVSSLEYKLLYECRKVLVIEQNIRKKKHEQLTGSEQDKAVKKSKQDYWCRKGNYYRNQIEIAERRVNEAEQNLREARRGISPRTKYAEKRLQHAKDNLQKKEQQLSQLEDRAYRSNIPASWHRCQYE